MNNKKEIDLKKIKEQEEFIANSEVVDEILIKLFSREYHESHCRSTFMPWLESTTVFASGDHYCAHCGNKARSLQGFEDLSDEEYLRVLGVMPSQIVFAGRHCISPEVSSGKYDKTGYRCGDCIDSVYEMATQLAYWMFKENTKFGTSTLVELDGVRVSKATTVRICTSHIESGSDGELLSMKFTLVPPNHFIYKVWKNNFSFKRSLSATLESIYYQENPRYQFALLVAKKYQDFRTKELEAIAKEIKKLQDNAKDVGIMFVPDTIRAKES
ncbi:hypothetical protein QTV49_004628 [Vibrio vulnificus]|nr:hypothetical protein [Vibrio vulnificus]